MLLPVVRYFPCIPEEKNTRQEKDVHTKMKMAMLHIDSTSTVMEHGWQIMM
jgi:hypothetical protein